MRAESQLCYCDHTHPTRDTVTTTLAMAEPEASRVSQIAPAENTMKVLNPTAAYPPRVPHSDLKARVWVRLCGSLALPCAEDVVVYSTKWYGIVPSSVLPPQCWVHPGGPGLPNACTHTPNSANNPGRRRPRVHPRHPRALHSVSWLTSVRVWQYFGFTVLLNSRFTNGCLPLPLWDRGTHRSSTR